jgi:hypothetical protein
MRRAGFLALVCGGAAITAGAAYGARAPLAAVTAQSGGSTVIARLDPNTLAPRDPKLVLGEYHQTWSFSPRGDSLALGTSAGGPANGLGIHIVDVATLAELPGITVPIAVEALAWLRPRRIAGELQGNTVFLADPVTGKIVSKRRVRAGSDCAIHPPAVATRRALVMLMGRLAVSVHADGRVRTASLRGLPDACAGAAIVLDRRHNRAFTVAGGSPVAEIDLRTMRVRRRRLSGPALNADDTTATWLGHGLIAAAHTRGSSARPAGVELIDTTTGTRRVVARRAGGVRQAGSALLVFDGGFAGRAAGHGFGLRAYGLTGRPRWRLLGGQRIWNVQVAGRLAYAIGSRGLAVVDLRTHRVLRRTRRAPDDVEFLSRAALRAPPARRSPPAR